MPNTRSQLLCGLLAVGMLFLSGCRKNTENGSASTQQATAAPAQTAPASKERHHRIFMSGVSPLIVSMSLETIRVHNGHASVARYALTYEINNAEKASKAYISIYAAGVGEVQRFDVDVQPRGQIEFLLDASDFDLGPTVRFRVHCPYGDTDWYLMGSDPMDYPQRISGREIGGVYPNYIAMHGHTPSGGIPVTISSGLIMKTCTAEAQVNFSSVDLQNIVATDKRINAVLPTDVLEGRPVTPRHLEVRLVVSGPGMPTEDVYNLDFVE
jgi:hypothetical protein